MRELEFDEWIISGTGNATNITWHGSVSELFVHLSSLGVLSNELDRVRSELLSNATCVVRDWRFDVVRKRG
jgi:hypothetical protein